MLTLFQYNTINETITSFMTKADFEAFQATLPAEQLKTISKLGDDLLLGFPIDAYAEYLLVKSLRDASHSDLENGALASSLGLTIDRSPITWGRPKPPTTYPELLMKWPKEAALIGAMAAKISHEDVSDPLRIIHAVQETLELGGYVEALTRASISGTDPTMALFALGISTHLRATRSDWFTDEETGSTDLLATLPPGVSGTSKEMADWEGEYENRLRRRDVARANAKKQREAKLVGVTAARQSAFAQIELVPSVVKAIQECVDGYSLSTFEVVVPLLTVRKPSVIGDTWLPTLLCNTLKHSLTFYSAEELVHTEQYFLFQLSKRLPGWFIELADGSLKFRKAPYVVKEVTLDRATKSLYRKLDDLITRYGITEVGDSLLKIAGKTPTWAELLALSDKADKV